jgi:beta-aspartyl-peptidase (threonine type)
MSGLKTASAEGYDAIARGGDALAGVEAAVRMLEEYSLFNAGRGSVLNEEGLIETDASIIDGTSGRFAAVAALSDTLHPVSAAAELLRRAPGPVLLVGRGAERFARSLGMPPEDLRTDEQVAIWNRSRRGAGAARSPFTGRVLDGSDTVGAIAVDAAGRMAAASSTGGTLLKMQGRVGDAAVLGAGIYSDERYSALCSGLGEMAIQLCLALRTVLTARAVATVDAAVMASVQLLTQRGAVGGVLLFDSEEDRAAVAHNSTDFLVVARDSSGCGVVTPVASASKGIVRSG